MLLLFGSSSHCAAVCCELHSVGAVYGAYSHDTTYMCVYIFIVFLVTNGSIIVDIKLYLHSLEESRVRVRCLDNVYRQS